MRLRFPWALVLWLLALAGVAVGIVGLHSLLGVWTIVPALAGCALAIAATWWLVERAP